MTQIYYSCCEFNVTALCNGKICQTLGADVLSIINIKHLTLCLLLHKEASIKLLKATFQAYRRGLFHKQQVFDGELVLKAFSVNSVHCMHVYKDESI